MCGQITQMNLTPHMQTPAQSCCHRNARQLQILLLHVHPTDEGSASTGEAWLGSGDTIPHETENIFFCMNIGYFTWHILTNLFDMAYLNKHVALIH